MGHGASTRIPPARYRIIAVVSALMVCAATVVISGPAAVADRDHNGAAKVFPSQQQVDSAKQRAAATARDVGAIKASLMLANQQLEQTGLEADRASEAYNGAMWRLQQATVKLHQAQIEVIKARHTVTAQRDAIGALVATSYQQGDQISALAAMMNADGPEGVLDQYAAFQGASTSLEAEYQRYGAADALARAFEMKARQARAEQTAMAHKARTAKEQATAAAAQAQAVAGQIATQKQALIAELADAQNISVHLAQKRQNALEDIARERAEARARALAKVAARAQARANAAAAAKVQANAAAAAKARSQAAARAKAARAASAKAAAAAKEAKTEPSSPPPYVPPAPDPITVAPIPVPNANPTGSGGARQAIAFAKAQLGEPYRWGAMGPSSWDCSGLMTGAWASAGVLLPHYSAAQYSAGTPISVTDLRPGDLVFWGTSRNPASIHHVAMYLGSGMIIHAPRTGQPVQISSMYYWIPPNFFSRV